MNTAIIVAAGSGTRFGGERPKQFVELLGRPMILHTLSRFEECPSVDEVVLVLSNAGMREFDSISRGLDLAKLRSVVAGGETRARSVQNGLRAVDPSTEIVAVHDGARPLVTSDEIARTIRYAENSGAACLVAEISDTVKRVHDGTIVETVDRESLRRALTPQAFRYDILRRAFDLADLDASVTDECYLVERLGIPIACVEGSSRNIKVTRPEDLKLAEMYLSVTRHQ